MAALLSVPSWVSSGSHDEIKIDGVRIGPPLFVCRVKGAGRKLKIERAKASGKDGGSLRLRGLELAQVHIDVTIWDGEGEEEWGELIVPRLLPLKDPSLRQEVLVEHPALQRYSITRLCLADIGEEPPRPDGILMGRIVLIEQRAKDGGATGKPKAAAAPPPVDLKAGRRAPDLRDVVGRPSSKVSLR